MFSQIFILVCVAVLYTPPVTCHSQFCESYTFMNYDPEVTDWSAARAICENMDMDLVVINSDEENSYIMMFLRSMNSIWRQQGWWIGGKFANGEWAWVDGSPMENDEFTAGHTGIVPDDENVNYAAILRHRKNGNEEYKWNYLTPNSANKLGIICEKNHC